MSETTPAALHLAHLEALVLDGTQVTPTEFTDARAALELEALTEEGRQARTVREAAVRAAKAREQAKVDAAALIAENDVDNVLALFDAARTAVEALRVAIDRHNTAVVDAANLLDKSGVPAKNPGRVAVQEPHFDPKNYPVTALYAPGPHAVVSDGTLHNPLSFDTWVNAIREAAGARTVPQAHYPEVLVEHLAALKAAA
jgi:hypothetical protein